MSIGKDIERLIAKTFGPRSQNHAAQEMGISQAYLSDIVNGRRGISAEVAVKMCKVFGKGIGDELYMRQAELALKEAHDADRNGKRK
jgi:addiction module HigA family antidote